MIYSWGHQKRYNDYGTYIRRLFKGRVQKISVHAGMTCPNRDGRIGTGGCTFCNNETFKPSYCQSVVPIIEQLKLGIEFFRKRHPEAKYLAYFQAYTNTYGKFSELVKVYRQALDYPGIHGLIIGTRPDCISDELLTYFSDLNKSVYVAVELGVESTRDETLTIINRGHGFQTTRDTIGRLADAGIPVGAHLILGLPGESYDNMLAHSEEISALPVSFLKIHQLQYVRNSVLGSSYQSDPDQYQVFKLDEYIELIVDFLERVRPEIVVERFASQAPHELLLAPRWGLKNFELAHKVEQRLTERNTWQGRLYG